MDNAATEATQQDQQKAVADGITPPAPGATTSDENGQPAVGTGEPAAGSKTAKKAAPKNKVGAATKGTTGNTTTTASGAALDTTQTVSTKKVAGTDEVLTVTGSDADQVKVYNGPAPMSPEDAARAAKGRDPLDRVVDENEPTGGLGPQAAAQATTIPFGPTGNVPTGSAHAVQATAEKALQKAEKSESKDGDPT